VLHDIFTEILVLDAYKDDKRICKLYDYGVSEEHYWVIMRFYRCSLKEWRLRQTRPLSENLVLYLNIFSRVLETMKICIKGDKFKINHFDLKCDNVLIDPIDPNIEEVRTHVPPHTHHRTRITAHTHHRTRTH
jgi:serine/threonine protein kinase